jgi:hypothetical protein
MGTAREIIQTAYRKAGVLPLLTQPSAAQSTIALTELNRLIYNFVGFGSSLPWEMVRSDAEVRMDPDDAALRIALQNAAPITITLDQQYADGQHALGKFRLSVMQEPAPAP